VIRACAGGVDLADNRMGISDVPEDTLGHGRPTYEEMRVSKQERQDRGCLGGRSSGGYVQMLPRQTNSTLTGRCCVELEDMIGG
jgi:hypothetical protein